jgi:hypothetical protein
LMGRSCSFPSMRHICTRGGRSLCRAGAGRPFPPLRTVHAVRIRTTRFPMLPGSPLLPPFSCRSPCGCFTRGSTRPTAGSCCVGGKVRPHAGRPPGVGDPAGSAVPRGRVLQVFRSSLSPQSNGLPEAVERGREDRWFSLLVPRFRPLSALARAPAEGQAFHPSWVDPPRVALTPPVRSRQVREECWSFDHFSLGKLRWLIPFLVLLFCTSSFYAGSSYSSPGQEECSVPGRAMDRGYPCLVMGRDNCACARG